MSDQLTNALTQDGYVDALTLGPAGNVRQLRFTGYSNAFVVQLWKYVLQKGNVNKWSLAVDDEYVYAPNTGDVFGPEVAGVRFRSYNAGNPAAIYAVLAFLPDPAASPVPPVPPAAPPTPGSAFQPIGQNQHTITAHTPAHLHTSLPCASIGVSALSTNVGNCYVGDSALLFSNGYILEPGDKVAFATGNANQVWVDGDNSGDIVSWMVVG